MSIAEKLTTVAENLPKVYDAGKKAQYDEFWNTLPESVDGVYLFSGDMWNDTTFKPNKNIRIKAGQGNGLFFNSGCTNIKKSLEDCGVTLDLSQVTQANSMFSYSNTTELPKLDLSNVSILNGTFSHAQKLVAVDELVIKDGATFTQTFQNALELETIIISGTISNNGFDIHWSEKLSAASLKSIIDALSTTTTNLTITLPTTAESNYNANPPEGAPQTWEELVATKNNWSKAYV